MEVVKNEELSDNNSIASLTENKEYRERVFEIAHTILSKFPKWFTIPRLVKEFKIDTDEASKKIELLMLFNVCIGKVEKNIPYFKIDLDHKTQREILSNEISKKEGELLFLKEKLSKLD